MPQRHDQASVELDHPSGAGCPAALEADTLSQVLRSVRLTGALFFVWDVSWPFATPVPRGRSFAPILLPRAQEIISYHIVTAGECWGGLIGEPPVRLRAGDILLIPHGDAYAIADCAEQCRAARVDTASSLGFFRQMAGGELPFVVADGGGGETATHLVCGFLGCDIRPFNPVLDALPRLLRLRRPAGGDADRLQLLIDYTLLEARQPRAGSQSVLIRLSELLFVEVVRRYLAERTDCGWLAALRDPVAGRALTLLHGDPAARWTLEKLARAAHVSRSRLAECFSRFVGQPPMQYLARWRMQQASFLLAEGSTKVGAVAREVGYDSEAAFSRAFKRTLGVSPAEWRRARSGGETAGARSGSGSPGG